MSYVKNALSGAAAVPGMANAAPTSSAMFGGSLNLLPWPQVDFAKFGPIEVKPLSRIKKISGPNLARDWVMIPAVTYHEDADITDLEALRVQLNKENEKVRHQGDDARLHDQGLCRRTEDTLNSMVRSMATIRLQKLLAHRFRGRYAERPDGAGAENADQKGVFEIAQETSELAKKAREGKLPPGDMQGATFTVSSVGGHRRHWLSRRSSMRPKSRSSASASRACSRYGMARPSCRA